ncbi:MAG: nucleoside triphosphate pyrophosphohydrolase [Candidatus Pacebacteria bacterium]|nr:nucleoside triphosphate pyrophosphohydrolase [Candidatus Paceibacterota bacterium]
MSDSFTQSLELPSPHDPAPSPGWITRLVEIMAQLRAPDGCPWDREQTHQTLKEFLMEEAAELFDAIDDEDEEGMVEELGDVLLQVVFHSQIASEEGRFNMQDVARVCCEKLIRRHPHVFGESEVNDAAGVLRQWETIKRSEKPNRRPSAISGVPRHLPALHRAYKMQKKAAKVGFDWPSIEGVVAKIDEELQEVKHALATDDTAAASEEIGDLLFAVVNLSRFQQRVPEELLHDTVKKFETRFRRIEELLEKEHKTPTECTLGELNALWNQAKKETSG